MNVVLAITGASGAYAAELFVRRSPWPVTLVVSDWGREVYRCECGPVEELQKMVDQTYPDDDLSAPISSGSVPTAGMVILPCSTNTMAQVAAGLGDTLIARAAHCHLKEHRKLVLCVRESPWSLIDLNNAVAIASAGGIIMPMSPPFYMLSDRVPQEVTCTELLDAVIDRVFLALGHAVPALQPQPHGAQD